MQGARYWISQRHYVCWCAWRQALCSALRPSAQLLGIEQGLVSFAAVNIGRVMQCSAMIAAN